VKPLRLGLLIDSEQKLRQLSALVMQTGQRVEYSAILPPSGDSAIAGVDLAALGRAAKLDAWLVDITHSDTEHSGDAEALSALMASAEIPVLLSDSSELNGDETARLQWCNRLRARLQRLMGEVNLISRVAADSVWVLAASTGGPHAVREFLQALPAGLGIGFLYAQHIDHGHCATLLTMLGKNSAYKAVVAEQGAVIEPDTVTVLDPAQRVEILVNSTLVVFAEPWGGRYQPSIDQLLANLASVKKHQSGVIVFSGMGVDGAASCRFIKQQRGQVWVQEPSGCVVDSMPQAALATNCVDFSGTPAQLARHLVHYMNQTNSMKGALSS